MNKKLLRILIGFAFFLAALFPFSPNWIRICLYIISYLISGGEVVYRAVKNLFHGNLFDENFLMSIATLGAFTIGEYPEAVAVMLFYQVGELFQDYAVGKSRKSIAELMNIRPDYANILTGETVTKVDPYDVKVGDRILIRPSEKVPLDCRILSGSSSVDTSSLTGESIPRDVSESDELLSGFVNLSGPLTAKVLKEFGESTVNKILDLVENASAKKSKSENFITRFAAYYTPFVVITAALLAVLPPLILKNFDFGTWIYRALTFLVVSCPCALVISVPLSFFGGIGGASRQGILVKGAEFLELLAKSETVVFDKTGTLTEGAFHVEKIQPFGISEEELLFLSAHAEAHSTHPISVAIRQAYGKELNLRKVEDIEELSGMGILCRVDGKNVAIGNLKLMKQVGIEITEKFLPGTVIYIAADGVYHGYIHIADRLKSDSKKAIELLKSENISRLALLTGDRKQTADAVANILELNLVYSELLPGDKVEKVEELLSQTSRKGKLIFVGDGINDAPVLKRADVGIAMGAMGSDAAMEAADVVIMTDEPSKIHTAIRIARKTVQIARQNIVLALFVKGAVLMLGALGFASMWAAVFADVGVTVLAVLNALRALQMRNS